MTRPRNASHPSYRPFAPLLFGLLCWAALTGGCAQTPQSTLTLTSSRSGQVYKPEFGTAYVSRSGNGDYDVVLTGESTPSADAQTAAAGAVGYVRQVVHVRVHYRPMRGARLDHPSASNASIRWFVLGDRPADVVEYAGAGFVTVKPGFGGDAAQVVVRNASLRPVVTRGNLADPLGPVSLDGTFVARSNRQRVDELLAQVRSAVEGDGPATPQASAR